MAFTLRVTDDMITNWQTGVISDDNKCPLAQALRIELESRGTPVSTILNASQSRGGCLVYNAGGYWYITYPTPQDTQPAIRFISAVDNLELGQPYPRKRIYHYGNPQSYRLLAEID